MFEFALLKGVTEQELSFDILEFKIKILIETQNEYAIRIAFQKFRVDFAFQLRAVMVIFFTWAL